MYPKVATTAISKAPLSTILHRLPTLRLPRAPTDHIQRRKLPAIIIGFIRILHTRPLNPLPFRKMLAASPILPQPLYHISDPRHVRPWLFFFRTSTSVGSTGDLRNQQDAIEAVPVCDFCDEDSCDDGVVGAEVDVVGFDFPGFLGGGGGGGGEWGLDLEPAGGFGVDGFDFWGDEEGPFVVFSRGGDGCCVVGDAAVGLDTEVEGDVETIFVFHEGSSEEDVEMSGD